MELEAAGQVVEIHRDVLAPDAVFRRDHFLKYTQQNRVQCCLPYARFSQAPSFDKALNTDAVIYEINVKLKVK